MTPATNNIRELETGTDLETKTPVRFIGSATPISDFLQLYDNKKPGKTTGLQSAPISDVSIRAPSNGRTKSTRMQSPTSKNSQKAETITATSELQATPSPKATPP